MDVTAASIGLSRDDFLAAVASTGLLTDTDFDHLLRQHPHADSVVLAASLAAAGKLTDYQIDAIVCGRADALRIGNYDVLDKLGAGGMGVVVKARHRRMKRVVALKLLSASLSDSNEFVRRFQREVETVARLSHPNVVLAFDADVADAGHFLVMEYVDGKDLVALVQKEHPLPVAVAAGCVAQAARGMAYAHGQGVVHRDIKPGNLLRDHTGAVKVTDLGLARLSAAEPETMSRNITQAGGVLGTIDYMAPEQAVDSSTTGPPADVYSLGCTLHFLLTGRPPFAARSVMAVLLLHREGEIPSLRTDRPDVPAELDSLFQRMLDKDPQGRPTMEQVAAELDALVATLPGGDGPLSGTRPAVGKSPSSVALSRPDVPTSADAKRVGVVVAEPSRVQGGIVRKYLEAQDVAVLAVATSGEAAAAAAAEHRPDVVVSAMHLPDMSGADLARRVRADTVGRRPGFVLISSEAETDTGSLSQLDPVAVLAKPFSPEQLVQALNVVAGKSVTLKNRDVSIARSSSLMTKPKADRAALKVLLADDSASARVHVRGVLRQLGFTTVTEVPDGAQAIAATAQQKYDLIVTDYNMPLMDGGALVKYLRQTPATAATPILMVTTETASAILDPVRAVGVAGIFDKAFPPAEVGAVLTKLFG